MLIGYGIRQVKIKVIGYVLESVDHKFQIILESPWELHQGTGLFTKLN